MWDNDLITQAERLSSLYREHSRTPFPYDSIRELVQQAGTSYNTLTPDLDLYFSTIAGYCSWGKGLLRWDDAKVEQAKAYASLGFFDRHQNYKPLVPLMRESDLTKELDIYERMRTTLLVLLTQLQKQRRRLSGEPT